MIGTMKSLGIRVGMDDFGAGHTSFKNLRRLGFDLVKIDGACIQNLARSPDDRFFVRALLDLARHLNIEAVVEWVEDHETASLLAEWGVDYAQGNFFGEARPPAPLTASAAALAPRSSALFGEAVEASAHLFELAPQVLDIGGAVLRTARVRLGRRGAGAERKWVEHCQSLTEHLHVFAGLVFQGLENLACRLSERRAAEGVGHLAAQFLLLANQPIDREVE